MSKATTQDRLEEEQVLMARCLDIQAFAQSEGAIEQIYEDFLCVYESGDCPEIEEACPGIRALMGMDVLPERWECADLLLMTKGSLWEYITPVRTYTKSGRHSYSWGWQSLNWFYASSRQKADELALKWFTDMDAKWLAKSKVEAA